MKVNKINRCVRCMKDLDVDGIFCPDCGYDQRQGNSERALPVGTVLNGKYSIGAVIGEGGFGITYAAWDMLIETRIAIKEYFPSELVTRNITLLEGKAACDLTLIQEKTGKSRYREGLERFIKEAENIAKFQKQPGVVSVKDFFYENNTAYMVMEYIDGVTLNSYLESRNGKLGAEETFRMIEPVMKTLEAIHKEGVIHRDISPDNIMVTADGQMKLIDFGAARFVGADDEKSLTVILKHGYAPEEQYRSNGEQGPWTDVYALSAVIYRMLTGKVPEETLKRMTEKQDNVRAELGKVPGLSAAERKSLEKGLAVKADRRYRTIGDLYDGLYGRKKWDIKKWVMGAGLAAVVIICLITVGTTKMKNKNVEKTFLEADNTLENKNDNSTEILEDVEETEEVEEELEEPEYVKALREYYNEGDFRQFSKPIFIDMTGDGNDEMIVAQKRQTENIYGQASDVYDVVVYQYKDGDVEAVYQSDDEKWTYYLFVEDGSAYIFKKFINFIDYNFKTDVSTSEVTYEKIFLSDTGNGNIDDAEYSDEELEALTVKSIMLLNERGGALLWNEGDEFADYQSILEHKEVTGEALEIAESVQEPILDYAAVYDEGNRCTFAVTGKTETSYNLSGSGEWNKGWYVYSVLLKDEILSVYACHDGQLEEMDTISPYEEMSGLTSGDWESKIYQFGKAQHYILELTGADQPYKQHKFCYEDGTARKTDESKYFRMEKNGKVRMPVGDFMGPALPQEYGNGIVQHVGYTDIFYYDHQYVEYGAEIVDNNVLEQYENYREILQEAEENLLKVTAIMQGQSVKQYDRIDKAKLQYIRKTANDTYYLNYKIYGKMKYGYLNPSEIVRKPDADGCYENVAWVYVVLNVTENRLEIENQYDGEKKEQSELDLPVYYGASKKMKPASMSKQDLLALIQEKSGKTIVQGSCGCYEDFDRDGKSELFVFMADDAWAYLGGMSLNSEIGCRDKKESAVGCELWFSDGEQTVLVAELKDGYAELSMDVLQFEDSLQCVLTRLMPEQYLSIDEILEADGYATTVCAVENGNPYVIIQDENMRFYQKEDSEEIGAYSPYGALRPDDYVVYKNGDYYWGSDSAPVFD